MIEEARILGGFDLSARSVGGTHRRKRARSRTVRAAAGVLFLGLLFAGSGCSTADPVTPSAGAIKPVVITEPTAHDTDDPAIWIHPTDRTKSLIIGTDKDTGGALYVFNLDGKIVQRVGGLKRPNNVD